MDPYQLFLGSTSLALATYVLLRIGIWSASAQPYNEDFVSRHVHGFFITFLLTVSCAVGVIIFGFGAIFVFADFVALVAK